MLISTYFLFVLVVATSMKAFFRTFVSAFHSEAPTQALAGILLLALSLYTGHQIPRPSMIGALRWISCDHVHGTADKPAVLAMATRPLVTLPGPTRVCETSCASARRPAHDVALRPDLLARLFSECSLPLPWSLFVLTTGGM